MTISVKKIAIIFCILFALIFIANYVITESIKTMRKGALTDEIKSAVAKNELLRKNKARRSTEMRPWKATDPEKLEELKRLGVRVRPRNHGPSTAKQWDEYVEKKIAESKIFESEEAKEAVKIMRVHEQEYEEKMNINKEHEEAVKKLLSEERFSNDHKERLQNIYKLRAIGNALKDKVVVK